MHVELFGVFVYVPGVQLVQLLARFVENVPTSHILQFIANPSEKVPASQPSQDVAPLATPV